MRKLVTPVFVSLDGVLQAPGGPDEDPSGGFTHGGWLWPYNDDAFPHGTADNDGRPYDLLLGRNTYDIFAGFWPHVDVDPASPTYFEGGADIANVFNRATKHVASRTRREFAWQNSRWLGEDAAGAVRALKQGNGPDLLTQGSGDFVQTLLAADLVDVLRLLIFPVTLGAGKRLFGAGTRPAAFRLTRTVVARTGVIVATYERDGALRTGTVTLDAPAAPS